MYRGGAGGYSNRCLGIGKWVSDTTRLVVNLLIVIQIENNSSEENWGSVYDVGLVRVFGILAAVLAAVMYGLVR